MANEFQRKPAAKRVKNFPLRMTEDEHAVLAEMGKTYKCRPTDLIRDVLRTRLVRWRLGGKKTQGGVYFGRGEARVAK